MKLFAGILIGFSLGIIVVGVWNHANTKEYLFREQIRFCVATAQGENSVIAPPLTPDQTMVIREECKEEKQ